MFFLFRKKQIRETIKKSEELLEKAKKTLEEQTAKVKNLSEERDRLVKELGEAEERQAYFRDREKKYIELIGVYMDSFRSVRRGLMQDDEWQRELDVMEEQLKALEKACQIQRIDEESGPVDYERHEVLSVLPAKTPAQDKTIAKLYRIGCISGDGITVKALVAAFKA